MILGRELEEAGRVATVAGGREVMWKWSSNCPDLYQRERHERVALICTPVYTASTVHAFNRSESFESCRRVYGLCLQTWIDTVGREVATKSIESVDDKIRYI